jgi:glycosyltransferase involved in cell wall biosynthesis
MANPSNTRQKIRLLQIVDSLHQGGMENIMVQVCNRLDPAEFEVTVCCLGASGPFAERLRPEVAVVSLGKPAGFRPATVRELRRIIRSNDIDLVHIHHLGGLIYVALARPLPRRLRPRLIHSEHIILHGDELSWRRRFQRTVLYRLASCVFTVSSQQLDQLRSLGLHHPRQFTLRNGVDGARFHPVARAGRGALREQLGLDPERFWIGKVARFAALKRHRELIEGFEAAAAGNPRLGLLLLGDNGEEKERVLARIAASPARDRIVWAGLQQDPVPWYQAMDLLVIASESEGMPNAALEAMSCGIPVLANEVCGIREVAGNGEYCRVEDLSTPERIASSLARTAALSDIALAAAGEAARRHAETHLSLEAMIEQYHRLYRGELF